VAGLDARKDTTYSLYEIRAQSRSTFGIRQLYRHPADRRLRLGPFRNYPAARPPVAA
jgi:hypothetical protein